MTPGERLVTATFTCVVSLRSLTNDVDDASSDDSPLATNGLSDITSDDSAKEGTSRQDGNDERVVGAAESGGIRTFDEPDEDLGSSDTVDVTGVVAEEDTTERREDAHHVRLQRHGRLDGVDIAGSSEARHGGGSRGGALYGVYA